MSRLWSCGFELNTAVTNVEVAQVVGSPTISTNQAHGGTYSARINGRTSGVRKSFDQQFLASVGSGPYWGRTYLYLVTAPSSTTSIISWTDATVTRCTVRLTSGGVLQLFGNTTQVAGTITLNTGQWYRVETKIQRVSNNNDTIEMFVDGVQIAATATGTLGGTVFSYNNGANLIAEAVTDANCDWYMDDIAVNDSAAGGTQTGYPGAGWIMHLHPDSAGDSNTFATQVGGTAGAANNFTRIDEVTPDDATSYNGSSTLNEEDLFNCEAFTPNAASITLVSVGGRVTNSVADTTIAIKYECEKTSGGTIAQGTAVVPNSVSIGTHQIAQPHTYRLTLYQDPDGANWTTSTLNSMQIGYKITTGPGVAGREIRNTICWALVEYVAQTSNLHLLSSLGAGT